MKHKIKCLILSRKAPLIVIILLGVITVANMVSTIRGHRPSSIWSNFIYFISFIYVASLNGWMKSINEYETDTLFDLQ